MLSPTVRDELIRIAGPRHVLDRPEDLRLYEYDGGVDKARPDVVVLPATGEQVSAIVKLAAQNGLPLVGRGAGTGLSGGSIPRLGGILVGFARMNRILEIDYANERAVVEPGVVNLDLTNAMQAGGYFFAPDPSSQRSCTIGGNVAENAGGPHTLVYGVTTNHVLGLEVVLANGAVVRTGAAWPDTPGYDLTGLLTGSEGTMALVTKVIVRLINEYGPTETVVGCSVYDGAQEEGLGPVSIGRPIANLRMHILDERQEPVPVGVAGEIYIGGAGVCRGYWERPELTAERFVPDALSGERGGRLYRTGDRGRYREDGNIEYLGREDEQVKIRGYRVELGEVEATLAEHPAVGQVAVVAQRSGGGEQRLVAYVAAVEGETVGAPELKAYLKERLPEYEVPGAYVVIERLPLTVNGKVDRAALPEPEAAQGEAEKYAAPRTAVESLLSAIWAGVLGSGRIGIHDNFFELGGHSLLATRIVSRIREAFDVEMPLRSMFEAPTIAEMAERVEAASRDTASVIAPIRRVERKGLLPVSYAQQRLWFLDRLEPGSATYNVPLALRLTGALDVAALEGSIQDIVRRHEVLRTRFVVVDEEPLQEAGVALPSWWMGDFRDRPDPEQAAREWTLAESRRPFELSTGPLFRASLLQTGDADYWLVLVFHHIVMDGWSLQVVVRDLGAFYQARVKHSDPSLPELPVQYADYACWQRQWLEGGVLAGQLQYWTQQLKDVVPLNLPSDQPLPPVQTFDGDAEIFEFPSPLPERVQRLSRHQRVTQFMVLLAAWKVLMARYSGGWDIAIGTPDANRGRHEIEGLIGFFVNTLVLRTDLSGDPTFREVLNRVRSVCVGAYAHQDVPFEKLVEKLQPERDLSRPPLFQVLFALHDTKDSDLLLPGLETCYLPLHNRTSKYQLNCNLADNGGQITGLLEYNTDLFERSTIRRMIGHYIRVLESVTEDPDVRISQIGLLTPAERSALESWNATAREFPARNVVELVEAQASRNAEAVAVEFEGRQMSFGELNRRANSLAHYLGELGVGTESRVGVCLERSLEVPVALLGVLKAGGAYVPLDPAYPAERLAYMASDAGIGVLLTHTASRAALAGAIEHEVCQESRSFQCHARTLRARWY